MPLSQAQKKDIQFILEDLLDTLFPCLPDEKTKEAVSQGKLHLLNLISYIHLVYPKNPALFDYLKDPKLHASGESAARNAWNALINKDSAQNFEAFLNRDPNVTQIGNCFCYPQIYLRTFEANNKVMLADVQEYILILLHKKIADFDARLLNQLNQAALCDLVDTKTAFLFAPAATTTWNPYALKETEETIFADTSFAFKSEPVYSFEENKTPMVTKVYLSLHLCFRANNTEEFISSKEQPNFKNDAEEDQFLLNIAAELQQQAFALAQKHAARATMQHLGVSIELHDQFMTTRLNSIITTAYYFNLFKEGKIPWLSLVSIAMKQPHQTEEYANERVAILTSPKTLAFLRSNPLNITLANLLQFTNAEIANLTHPSIYCLIQSDVISASKARKLSASARQLSGNPIFFSMLKDSQKLSISELEKVAPERIAFITLPPITRLIKLGILSFAVANRLPIHLRPMLVCSAYATYFSKSTNWNDVCKLQAHQAELAANCHIAPLVCNQVISLIQLAKFSALTVRMIERSPCIAEEFTKNPGLVDSIHTESADAFNLRHFSAYALRLIKLAAKTPYRLDDRVEAKQKLYAELPQAATDCHLTDIKLRHGIYSFIMLHLKTDLVQRANNTANIHLKKIFARLLIAINMQTYQSDSNVEETCRNLFVMSERIVNALLKDKYKNIDKTEQRVDASNRFKPSRKDFDSLLTFCQLVLELDDFIDFSPAKSHRNFRVAK